MKDQYVNFIALIALTFFGAQLIHETNLNESEELKHNPMASIVIPLRNYPPLPDHGPHSQGRIVNTMDGIIAVTTSSLSSSISIKAM